MESHAILFILEQSLLPSQPHIRTVTVNMNIDNL